MSKSMLVGVVAGVAIATVGGVAGYQFLGQPKTAEVSSVAAEGANQGSQEIVVARADTATLAPGAHPVTVPAHPAAKPVAPRPAARPVAVVAAAPAEECWDEEVTVAVDPKDGHQIAGTAAGAVVGGAIGKDVGDRNLTTVAGAAAGAFIGKKIQQKIQENRAEKRTTTTLVHHCAPVGTPH